MYEFTAGILAMGYFVAGLFFLRFWFRTREGLFAIFASAFWLLAVNQTLVAIAQIPREEHSWIYILRLAAFSLIDRADIVGAPETRHGCNAIATLMRHVDELSRRSLIQPAMDRLSRPRASKIHQCHYRRTLPNRHLTFAIPP